MTSVEAGATGANFAGKPGKISFAGKDLVLSGHAVRSITWVLISFLGLRLVGMVVFPFNDSTEARYAEIARIMVETGNWITPQFDYGVPFWGKPPLHTWLAAIGMKTLGISEFAARLPIFLTSLSILALVFVWVRDVVGRNVALLSVAVLSSMGLFFGASAFVMTDMPMVLGTTMVMVGFWNTVNGDDNRPIWGYAIFVGLAVGMLAKGPVAVVLSGIPVFGWLAVRNRWDLLTSLPWLKGLALMAVLTVPWYVLAENATPGFLRYFLIGEHFERFVIPGWTGDLYGTAHTEPKGQIWVFWLATIFPWTFILLLLGARPRRIVHEFRADQSGWLFYLLLWALSPLLLFTPAGNILHAYTLPGLPAAAVLFVVLSLAVCGGRPGKAIRTLFSLGLAVSFGIFATLFALSGTSSNTLRLKNQKELAAVARSYVPETSIYMVGGRSFSGSFYTNGSARIIALRDLPDLVARGEPVALSVPETLAAQVATLDVVRIGAFGRRVLFVFPTGKVRK